MEEVLGVCLLTALGFLGGIGVVHIATDYRHFGDVEKQCKEQGFIQDTKTRILCQIDGTK